MTGQKLLTAVVPIASMSGRLQNFSNWVSCCSKYSIELIVVEDGSDRSTLDELTAILRKHPSLEHSVISGTFGSAGNARNEGIKQASGRWICFWDSDDDVIVDEFIKMVELADKRNLDAIVGNFEIVSELDGRVTQPLGQDLMSLHVLGRMPGLWRMAFRREKIGQTLFQPFKVAEDHHFLVEIDFERMNYRFFNSIVYRYFTGGKGHVTRNPSALEDLYPATVRMYANLQRRDKGQILLFSFLLREAFSTLKYCSRNSKVALLNSTMHYLKKSELKVKIQTLKILLENASLEIKLRLYKRNSCSTTAILVGGLGNQLFQTMAALATAGHRSLNLETNFLSLESKKIDSSEIARYSFPPNTSIIKTRKWQRLTTRVVSYCLRVSVAERGFENSVLWRNVVKVIGSLYFSVYYWQFSSLQLGNRVGYSEYKLRPLNQVLIGYFQSYHWHDQLTFTWPSYEVSLKKDTEMIREYYELALDEKPLVIHLRFGDYLKEPAIGSLPVSYYLQAYQCLMSDKQFKKIWVFSDDIEMAQNFLPIEMHSETRWIGDIDKFSSTSLEIMRFGVAYIISNSTFGWWGARLSINERPNVYAPSPWFRGKTSPIEILSPDWHTLPAWN